MSPALIKSCYYSWRDRDMKELMNRLSPFIYQYIQYRFTKNPDIAGDFFIHVYERIPHCLYKFSHRRRISFDVYLKKYLKLEWFNYYRKINKPSVMKPEELEPYLQSLANEHRESYTIRMEVFGQYTDDMPSVSRLQILTHVLEELSSEMRLPIKLYYGLSLGKNDPGEIRRLLGSSEKSDSFIQVFQERRKLRDQKIEQLKERMHYLNYMIHSCEDDDTVTINRYRRWKRRTRKSLGYDRWIMNLSEIGELYSVSKTTIHRRIRMGFDFIRGEMENPKIEEKFQNSLYREDNIY